MPIIDDPFDLSEATIRDGRPRSEGGDGTHVQVWRSAPQPGDYSRCTYRKEFQAKGVANADYWTDRENRFLNLFIARGLKRVVNLSSQTLDGNRDTPIVKQTASADAGLTIEAWLKQKPRYDSGKILSHPFQHAGMLLLLLRACLTALKEIHQHRIVHLDIKEDNICLDYRPYPFRPASGGKVEILFDRLKLIDFAFSISPDMPLKYPLPITPVGSYQSPRLKAALEQDQAWEPDMPIRAEALDWRCDLYSLGYMFEQRILNLADPVTFKGRKGVEVLQGLYDSAARLQTFDGLAEPPDSLPHDGFIEKIDALLEGAGNFDGYRSFSVVRNTPVGAMIPMNAETTAAGAESGDIAENPATERTPITPMRVSPRRSRTVILVLALASIAVGTAWVVPSLLPRHLDCPMRMDKEAFAGFEAAATGLWQRVEAGEHQAMMAWVEARAAQAQVLERTQPSPSDPRTKARALNCLIAMAVAGDRDALEKSEQFNFDYFTTRNASEDWLKISGHPRGEPPAQVKLWLENLTAWLALDDNLYMAWANSTKMRSREIARLVAADDAAFIRQHGVVIP